MISLFTTHRYLNYDEVLWPAKKHIYTVERQLMAWFDLIVFFQIIIQGANFQIEEKKMEVVGQIRFLPSTEDENIKSKLLVEIHMPMVGKSASESIYCLEKGKLIHRQGHKILSCGDIDKKRSFSKYGPVLDMKYFTTVTQTGKQTCALFDAVYIYHFRSFRLCCNFTRKVFFHLAISFDCICSKVNSMNVIDAFK